MLAALAFFALLGVASPGAAHLGSRKYLRVEVTERLVVVEVDVEGVDVSMELGLGDTPDVEAIGARYDALARWLREGITVEAAGARCEVRADEPEPIEHDGVLFYRVRFEHVCGEGRPLVLHDATVFPEDVQHEAIVRLRFVRGTDATILRRGRQSVELGEPAGAGAIARVFLWEGVLHFATGYDHVLFLLSLVLAAGFVVRKEGAKKALRDVAILVTAFTLGHSVTLVLAALGVVVLPAQPVEVIIAASIVVVALWNVWRPESRGPMPWIAGGFGLVHGFGFSSVLAELGLPRAQSVLALVCFNVGIELAQLAFVALMIGPLAWAARTRGYRGFVRGGSVVIALLAVFWVVERLTE